MCLVVPVDSVYLLFLPLVSTVVALTSHDTVHCFVFFCMSFCNSFFSGVTSKTAISLLLRNPDVVFVADLTRADAPALVLSTQCELLIESCAKGSQITAVINDLKVRRGKCIILGRKV